MNRHPIDADAVKKYLLGQLSESEVDRLEELYFVDRAFFAQVLAAETDIVNRYVNGRLSAADAGQFERILPTMPAVERMVAVASAEHRRLKVSGRRNLFLAMAAACVLLSVFALRPALVRLSRSGAESSPRNASAVPPLPPPSVFHLTPGVGKGAASQVVRLAIPAGTARISITMDLPVPVNALAWRATLRPVDNAVGGGIWNGTARADTGDPNRLWVDIPASVLSEGDYFLDLEAPAPQARFTGEFRVAPRAPALQ